MRSPNTVDFWRGFALVEIVINHIPGNSLTRLTHSHYSWSDSAELFVFLAGWAFGRRLQGEQRLFPGVLAFVGVRFGKIYIGQLTTSLIVVCLYGYAAQSLSDFEVLQDNNAALAATSPGQFLTGVLLLTQQMRFVDVLPLYLLFILATPMIFIVGQKSNVALLSLSTGLFGISLLLHPQLPTWPGFFNPLSWQAMLVIGFVIGGRFNFVETLVQKAPLVVPVSWAFVAFSVGATIIGASPLAEPSPDSFTYYFFAKSSLGLLPLPQFLALALIASRLTFLIAQFLPNLWSLLSLLGRNSLAVFCVGTVLSAVGQICHRAGQRGVFFDLIFMLGATAILLLIAKARDYTRSRSRTRPIENCIELARPV